MNHFVDLKNKKAGGKMGKRVFEKRSQDNDPKKMKFFSAKKLSTIRAIKVIALGDGGTFDKFWRLRAVLERGSLRREQNVWITYIQLSRYIQQHCLL
jgi:hypothetical protein